MTAPGTIGAVERPFVTGPLKFSTRGAVQGVSKGHDDSRRGPATTYSEEHLLRLRALRKMRMEGASLAEIEARLPAMTLDAVRVLVDPPLPCSRRAQPARRRRPTYNNGPRDVPVARPPAAAWFAAAGTEAPRDFLWPVEGGVLWQAFGSMGGRHRALDIGLRCGATIRAAHGGLVVYSDNFLDGLGNAVVTVAPGGWVSIYGHARRTHVPVGAMVARAQPIAEMGDTGAAVGCHVHFVLLRDGARVDPAPRMVGRSAPSAARRAR